MLCLHTLELMRYSGDHNTTDRKKDVNKSLAAHLGCSCLFSVFLIGNTFGNDENACARLVYVLRPKT